MDISSLRRTGDPAVEPATLADMKAFMRIEPSDDTENAVITAMIKAAAQKVEKHLNRALITQTWCMVMDDAPSRIMLDYPPLQSVTSIKSYSDANVATTNDSDNYTVVTNSEPGQIILKPGSSWTDRRRWAGFEVIYVAGYGDAATDVPSGIIHGIKVLVTKMYHRRGDDINTMIMESDVQGWISSFKAY